MEEEKLLFLYVLLWKVLSFYALNEVHPHTYSWVSLLFFQEGLLTSKSVCEHYFVYLCLNEHLFPLLHCGFAGESYWSALALYIFSHSDWCVPDVFICSNMSITKFPFCKSLKHTCNFGDFYFCLGILSSFCFGFLFLVLFVHSMPLHGSFFLVALLLIFFYSFLQFLSMYRTAPIFLPISQWLCLIVTIYVREREEGSSGGSLYA